MVHTHGRWLVLRTPVPGLGITGYDKVKKKYVGIWIDTMSTSMMHTEGEFNEAANTLTEIGETNSPMGEMRMKMVCKHENKDKFLFTMYRLMPDGSENKMMEIVYTRE